MQEMSTGHGAIFKVCAGGVVNPDQTTDHEEKEQCSKMHDIIKQYKLDGEFRSALNILSLSGLSIGRVWEVTSREQD